MATVSTFLHGILGFLGLASPVSHAPQHIVVVIEENHGYSQVVGNADMPYLNKVLIDGGLLLTNSHGVEHPSQPNYLDLFSGDNQGITTDGPVPGASENAAQQTPLTAGNLAAALIHKGYSFSAYSQSLPAPGSLAYFSDGKTAYAAMPSANPGAFIYARKHNPWTNWQAPSGYARRGNGSNTLPASINRPMSAFPAADFAALPTVSYVIPNQCNDMHGGVSGSKSTENCPYASSSGDADDRQLAKNADHFLRTWLGAYAAWAKAHDSLLIVTWDEDFHSDADNHIATVIYGAGIKPGSKSSQHVNHYNILATIATDYHLDLAGLGHAAAARPVVFAGPEVKTP